MKELDFDNRNILGDALATQYLLSRNYNEAVSLAADTRLRADLLHILSEEHLIQAELLNEMSKRGWYTSQPADEKAVQKVKQHYQDEMSS